MAVELLGATFRAQREHAPELLVDYHRVNDKERSSARVVAEELWTLAESEPYTRYKRPGVGHFNCVLTLYYIRNVIRSDDPRFERGKSYLVAVEDMTWHPYPPYCWSEDRRRVLAIAEVAHDHASLFSTQFHPRGETSETEKVKR